jgi:hypothetical protein
MVGKPNIAQSTTPSQVNPVLDEERALSMADEGGAYPAQAEAEESLPAPSSQRWRWAAAGVTALVGGWGLYRLYRDRSAPSLRPE